MDTFKVGDKVICVEPGPYAASVGKPLRLIKNKIYTILFIAGEYVNVIGETGNEVSCYATRFILAPKKKRNLPDWF